ncbi:hypothetical protein N7520_005774 [Penicillium odoratum]|uniref:uncharacterized protein n=1 Tax=Penicillium odoratum TaxID=1167516 RepID=UPI0025484560|nr:uncharacterized protein N7520_005774 [Penicillium odoratum]KAJ5758618.1 hypothetical protein N7520_005774 [Penicillium odoratum]
MSPPEMSYSPAYHQAQGRIIPPLVPSSLEHPKSVYSSPLPSSEWMAHDVSPRTSGPRGSQAHSPQTSPRASRVGDEGVKPVTVTNGSPKEERSGGSWQPSLMSGEHTRVPKRAGVPEATSSDAGQDAFLMLFRLSVPVPLFSFAACIYTFFAIIFAILISPLRVCSISPYLRKTSFRTQLCDLLSPVLHIHERIVCMPPPTSNRSSSTQWIHSDPDSEEPIPVVDSSILYSVGMSIVVLTLSPFFSIAILLCAWTAAAFWVFAMVMGNPDGTERNDDGRAAVLGVCKWWRTWLGKCRSLP